MNCSDKECPFYLLTLSLVFIFVVSCLIQDGAFLDGVLYTSVAKNLVEGRGSFWAPHFSKTSMSFFHEQPPLYFGILALFYKAMGTGIYTERIFSLACYLASAFLIHKIWGLANREKKDENVSGWLPVLLWTSVPVCYFAYGHMLEEALMSVWILGSVFFMMRMKEGGNPALNIILAGIFIFLSSLTKGIQGTFPLIFPVLSALVFRTSFIKGVAVSAGLAVIVAGIYGLFFLSVPESLDFFQAYADKRLAATFAGTGATTDNRFDLLLRLIVELSPVYAVILIVSIFSKKNKINFPADVEYKNILLFLLLGLAGSLPLMVTREQRGFYLTPSIPFFALAASFFLSRNIHSLIQTLRQNHNYFRAVKLFSLSLFAFSLVFTAVHIPKTKNFSDGLHDVYLFKKHLPPGEIINIPPEMWNDWYLHNYMNRYLYVSLDPGPATQRYYLSDKALYNRKAPENYRAVLLKTKKYTLYRKE